jgi:hypothetical protein
MRGNCSNSTLSISIRNQPIASSVIVLGCHDIVADITQNLINLTHILLLHLSVEFIAWASGVHCLILLIEGGNTIVVFSILTQGLSYLSLRSVLLILINFFWGGSVTWSLKSSFFVEIHIIFVNEKHGLIFLLRGFFVTNSSNFTPLIRRC